MSLLEATLVSFDHPAAVTPNWCVASYPTAPALSPQLTFQVF
jgi:hypothetical protein